MMMRMMMMMMLMLMLMMMMRMRMRMRMMTMTPRMTLTTTTRMMMMMTMMTTMRKYFRDEIWLFMGNGDLESWSSFANHYIFKIPILDPQHPTTI